MSYRIDYEPKLKHKYPVKQETRYFLNMAAVVALLAAIVLLLCNPTVHMALQKILLPGDAMQTKAAINQMIVNLKDGETIKHSVTAFCMEILSGVQ